MHYRASVYLVPILFALLIWFALAANAEPASRPDAAAPPTDEPTAEQQARSLTEHLIRLDGWIAGQWRRMRSLSDRGQEANPELEGRARRLRDHLRALESEAARLAAEGETDLTPKLRALRGPAFNLERAASGHRPRGSWPGLEPHESGGGVIAAAEAVGCEAAAEVHAGVWRGALGATEENETAEVWLRFVGSRAGQVDFAILGHGVDPAVSVYSDCPANGGRVLAKADDSYGLAARLGHPLERGGSLLLRVRAESGGPGSFTLRAVEGGGGFSGTVTREGTGLPVSGFVEAWDLNGFYAGSTFFGGGSYTVGFLATGSYFATTDNFDGLLDELWDDFPCPDDPFSGGCDPTRGTPIRVQSGATTPGIDFALGEGGAVTGRVREAATGTAVSFAFIQIWDANANRISSAFTDAAGRYRAVGLGNAPVFVTTSTSLRDEVYDDIPCENPPYACDPTAGTPLPAAVGTTLTGIDFRLERFGSIAGTVVDAMTATPISFTDVYLWTPAGGFVSATTADALGRYSVGGLDDGTYVVVTQNFEGYLDELWDDRPCAGPGFPACPVSAGDPIVVSAGAAVTGIDFALERQGTITGTITESTGGAPIAFSSVYVFDATGTFVVYGFGDATGQYQAIGLEPGSHYVVTATNDYLDEIYDDLPCPGGGFGGCDPTTGTPVTTALNTVTGGIDFALDRFGRISGTLTDAATHEPIAFEVVRIFDSDGSSFGIGFTGSDGSYVTSPLPSATYFAVTDTFEHSNELYDDLPCPGGGFFGCDPTTGTPIVTQVNMDTGGIDFALNRLSSISGTAVSSAGGAPVEVLSVAVWDASGAFFASDYSAFNGDYVVDRLPPGTYFVTANGAGFFTQLYENLPCPGGPPVGCTVTAGTPVVVTLGSSTGGIDFTLDPGPGLAGTVTAGGRPLAGVAVDVWDSGGVLVDSLATGIDGAYFVFLSAGSYFVSTDNGLGATDEVYDNLACPDGPAFLGLCDPALGTSVSTSSTSLSTGIDFDLEGLPLFRDGFESGDLAAWSATVP